MFDDDMYYELCIFYDRSLFGVSDEITDMMGSLDVTPSMRLYLPRVEARLRGIIALKAYVAS